MVDIDPTFVERLNPGDIMVAGKNFGCGSSREHAPLALKTAGVSCVIAQSLLVFFIVIRLILDLLFWNVLKLLRHR